MKITRLFLMNDRGEFAVLIRQYAADHPKFPGERVAVLPGGQTDAGESAADCVLRETTEEVGVRVLTLLPLATHVNPQGLPMIFYVSWEGLAHWDGVPEIREPEKFLGGVRWVRPEAFVGACAEAGAIPGYGIVEALLPLTTHIAMVQ